MQTIEDILRNAGVSYVAGVQHKHVRHGWIGVDCPFCGTKDKNHLGINLHGRFASCWRCGPHSLVRVFSALLHVPPGQAHFIVQSIGGTPVVDRATVRGTYTEPKGLGPLLPAHENYLRSRGFDPEQIKQLWGVRGIGRSTRLGWRLWIPIRHQMRPVSWTTRSLSDDANCRYITAKPEEESLSPKQILYGEEYARSTIIIVEGPIDAWRLGPGVVATLGLQYTQAQVKRMAQYPVRYVCFDSSPDAVRRSRCLVDQLSLLPGQTNLLLLDADDPGSASPSEVRCVRKSVFGSRG